MRSDYRPRDRRWRRGRVRPGGAAERRPRPPGPPPRSGARLRRAYLASCATARDRTLGSHDWDLESEPGPSGSALRLPRGKVIGGSSTINGAFALRGSPRDFDDWSAAGNRDGPGTRCSTRSKRSSATSTSATEPFHGSEGPVPIRRYSGLDAATSRQPGRMRSPPRRAGRSPTTTLPGAVGVGPLPVNEVGGTRMGAASTYLAAARGRPNLTVRGDASSTGWSCRRAAPSGCASPPASESTATGSFCRRRLPQPRDPAAVRHRPADELAPRRDHTACGPARGRPQPRRPSRGVARPRVRGPASAESAPLPARRHSAQPADRAAAQPPTCS